MLSVFNIVIPFLSALLVLFAPKKLAKKIALLSAIVTLIFTMVAFFLFDKQGGEQFSINISWIEIMGCRFHLGIDGISLIMLLISNLLMPFILLLNY